MNLLFCIIVLYCIVLYRIVSYRIVSYRIVLFQINGCYEFFISAESIKLGYRQFSSWGMLSINANVTEEQTGRIFRYLKLDILQYFNLIVKPHFITETKKNASENEMHSLVGTMLVPKHLFLLKHFFKLSIVIS